ncbi:unnamed protein product [Prorocentrum cordatum]|uniref:Uncharacterized protein n=1 Tax=Prorocentrum cordatum TaxID=2364126 RepID=A0ABN9VFE8_9DINO|nr:unnamed protein product [Polarella glacialis]
MGSSTTSSVNRWPLAPTGPAWWWGPATMTTRAPILAPRTCSTGNSGSAYVLDGATGERLLKLVASDGAAGDYFGTSVAVSSDGARVVVGARGDDRLLKLVASDGARYEKFGNSVAVSSDGARVVVGAYYGDDQGTQSGSAYVFDGTIVTTETATSSATSSTTTTIKTTTETTTETTTATTTETATTTTDTGTSSDTSNTTATTEPWGLIAVFAGVLIFFIHNAEVEVN